MLYTGLVILVTAAPLSMRRQIKSRRFAISATSNAVQPSCNICNIRERIQYSTRLDVLYIKFEWPKRAHHLPIQLTIYLVSSLDRCPSVQKEKNQVAVTAASCFVQSRITFLHAKQVSK